MSVIIDKFTEDEQKLLYLFTRGWRLETLKSTVDKFEAEIKTYLDKEIARVSSYLQKQKDPSNKEIKQSPEYIDGLEEYLKTLEEAHKDIEGRGVDNEFEAKYEDKLVQDKGRLRNTVRDILSGSKVKYYINIKDDLLTEGSPSLGSRLRDLFDRHFAAIWSGSDRVECSYSLNRDMLALVQQLNEKFSNKEIDETQFNALVLAGNFEAESDIPLLFTDEHIKKSGDVRSWTDRTRDMQRAWRKEQQESHEHRTMGEFIYQLTSNRDPGTRQATADAISEASERLRSIIDVDHSSDNALTTTLLELHREWVAAAGSELYAQGLLDKEKLRAAALKLRDSNGTGK